MDRIVFKNSQGTELVGMLHQPKKPTQSVVVIVHGFLATKDRPRLKRMAETLIDQGIAAFRFDCSGCGESQETIITFRQFLDDMTTALALVKSKGFTQIGILGESLGGLMAIRTCTPDIKTLILWAPVTTPKTPSFVKDTKLRNEIDRRGCMELDKQGRTYIVDKEYVEAMEKVDTQRFLGRIKCPVLIIHGKSDNEIPVLYSRQALKYLPKTAMLVEIQGATHTLDEKMDDVIARSVAWAKQHLSSKDSAAR